MQFRSQPRATALIAVAFAIALLPSQAFGGREPSELAAPLMKLTRAVEAELVYGEKGANRTDDELLEAAMNADPPLRKELEATRIRMKHGPRRIVILVCSPDSNVRWLEDASWTPEIDKKWFDSQEDHPCEFTMEPVKN